jgi:hypothetical protein
MEYANHTSAVNGRVMSPDISESGRISRQGRSQRLSLSALKGGATSVLPDMNEPRRTNTVHSRTDTVHSLATNHVPAPTNHQSNGMFHPESSTATSSPHIRSDQRSTPAEKTEPSKASSNTPHEAPTVKKRRSIFGGSTTSDATEPAVAAPAPATNDEWGRSLKESLGSNISISRFETHGGNKTQKLAAEEVAVRPVTAESEKTSSTGKAAKKRFSLIRLGMKKSGNSLSAKSDLEGVEEKS